jgi:hypothetical protein
MAELRLEGTPLDHDRRGWATRYSRKAHISNGGRDPASQPSTSGRAIWWLAGRDGRFLLPPQPWFSLMMVRELVPCRVTWDAAVRCFMLQRLKTLQRQSAPGHSQSDPRGGDSATGAPDSQGSANPLQSVGYVATQRGARPIVNAPLPASNPALANQPMPTRSHARFLTGNIGIRVKQGAMAA